jgi:hypothetical protein
MALSSSSSNTSSIPPQFQQLGVRAVMEARKVTRRVKARVQQRTPRRRTPSHPHPVHPALLPVTALLRKNALRSCGRAFFKIHPVWDPIHSFWNIYS